MLSVADETGDTIGAGQRAPSLNRLESVGGVANVDAAVSQQPTDLARADATSNDDPVGLFTMARDATDVTARQAAADLEGSLIVERQEFRSQAGHRRPRPRFVKARPSYQRERERR